MTRPFLALVLLSVLVLAGCTGSPSETGTDQAAKTGGGGSEVHGTMSAVGDSPAVNGTDPTDSNKTS